MTKALNQDHADTARKAIDACGFDPDQNLETSVSDLLADLAHLCDAESLDFVTIATRSIRHWQVERIDPASVAEGPVVEITIGKEGLPSPPQPKKRPDKRRKSRPA